MNNTDVKLLAEQVVTFSEHLSKSNVPAERITYSVTAFIRQCVIELFDREEIGGADLNKERPIYERHKRSNLDDIVIATRLEAEKMLVHLRFLIENFGVATIADLCDAVGMPCRHQDHIFGWTDLSTASISRVDAGYVIVFPFTRSVA